MTEDRKSVYYLLETGKEGVLAEAVKNIKGVTEVNVDSVKKTLEYRIDEWSSDYDVFTEVMQAAESVGASFDFSHADEERKEIGREITAFSGEKPTSEVLPDEVEETDKKPAKPKKHLSERAERIIELSFSAAFLIAALFLTDTAQLILFAMSFTLSGYDILYSAIVKIAKKQFVSEELLTSLAFVAALVLGKAEQAVIASLIVSAAAFFAGLTRELIEKNDGASMSVAKTATAIDAEGNLINKQSEKVTVGERCIIRVGDGCPFDGTLESESATAFRLGDGKIPLTKGDAVFSGDCFEEDITMTVEKTSALSKVSAFDKAAKACVQSRDRIRKYFDKYGSVFIIGIFAFCLLLAFIPPIFASDYTVGLYRWGYAAVIVAIASETSYLVSSLSLSMLAALVRGKEAGVTFKNAQAISKIARANAFVFDKEGAFDTDGVKLIKTVYAEGYKGKIKEMAKAALYGSATVYETALKTTELREKPAAKRDGGVFSCRYLGSTVICGGAQALEKAGYSDFKKADGNALYVFWDGAYAGAAIFSDAEKSDCKGTIRELRDTGVEKIYMLSSDENVEAFCSKTKIKNVTAPITDEQKEKHALEIALSSENATVYCTKARLSPIDDAPTDNVSEAALPASDTKTATIAKAAEGAQTTTAERTAKNADKIPEAAEQSGSDESAEICKKTSEENPTDARFARINLRAYENCDYSADASVFGDGIAYVPYIRKLAARTRRIMLQNVILCAAIKIAVATLAIVAVADLWWAVLIDMGANILCALNALRNRSKIY